jgi:hypothetical protein
MNFDQALVRGRSLLTRSESGQWELARLTHQVIAKGKWGRSPVGRRASV